MIDAAKCYDRKCIFYIGVNQPDGTELTEHHICHAYPDGIPEEITEGEDLHLTVRDDQDNEIVFEENEQ